MDIAGIEILKKKHVSGALKLTNDKKKAKIENDSLQK